MHLKCEEVPRFCDINGYHEAYALETSRAKYSEDLLDANI